MPYIGEIRMFAGNFAPVGWLFCRGQLLPISEHETLFNLIGTTYGGDGETTFMLPDLQGRLPVSQGQGRGLAGSYVIGEKFGYESVTLRTPEMPMHNHGFLASTAGGVTTNPQGAVAASPPDMALYLREGPSANFPAGTVTPRGGSQPHENRAPVLAINYIISLFGVFPSPT